MKKKQKVQIFKLEERVLFDGAAAAEIAAAVDQAGEQNQNQPDDHSDNSDQDKEQELIQKTVQNAGPVDTPAPDATVQNAGLVFLRHLVAVGQFLHAVQHLRFGLIDLTLRGVFCCFRFFWSLRNCRSILNHWSIYGCFYFRSSGFLVYCFFTNPLFEDVFLRVHN